ncbi:MAG: tyrosine-protein phosphatase [Firmicutes bacterium]|nr:tyrosine-protein phosphatase [Bacillota bacterium]
MNEPVNFRDLGGLVGAGGKKIKPKRLLRSAELIDCMPQGYGITQIIDLRTAKEAKKNPAIFGQGVNYVRVTIETGSFKGHKIGSLIMRGKVNECHTCLLDINKTFVTFEPARNSFANFIIACANNNHGATLFYCRAGKDRTGFAAALLLKLLGVSDADIMADYLKTNELRTEANKLFIKHYRRRGLLFKKQQEALGVILGAKPEYLQAAFDAINEAFGSFEQFIAKGLGVNCQVVEQLRQLYLE